MQRSDTDSAESRPWPPPEEGSALGHLARTWQEITFRPTSFFAALPRGGRLGGPLVFYLIIGTIAAAIRLFWRLTFTTVLPEGDSALLRALRAGDTGSPLVEFLLTPVILLLSFGLAAVITHFALWVVGGAREGMSTTAAVLAYASAPQLFVVVPVLGTVIGMVWALVLLVVGLREAHRTSTTRAVIAVLLPVMAMGVLLVLLLVALLATGGAGLLIPDLPA